MDNSTDESDEKEPKRHTHNMIAALEDVIALEWEIIDGLADALLVAKSKAARALEILKIARKSPHSYDPDTAEERKIRIKKR